MAIVRVVRQRTSSLLLVELVLLMLFCMATAAVTSIGRFHLGSEEASASRYQAFALLFWSSLGLSILLYASRRQRWLQSYSAVLLAIMVGFATQVRLPLIDAQWHQLQLKRISLALITGVHDPTVLADAYPAPEVVLRDAEYMKQHRLSIFHEDTYQLLGKKLESVYRVVAQNQCSGFVSSSQVLPANSGDGLRLTGYAWDRELQRPARDIFATADGRISGLGTSVTIPLRPGSAGPYAEPSRFGWIAFVLKSGPHARIELYALVGKSQGAACPFAEIAP